MREFLGKLKRRVRSRLRRGSWPYRTARAVWRLLPASWRSRRERRVPSPEERARRERAAGEFEEVRGILDRFARETEDVFFVQIGSYDGVSGDPIHRYIRREGWRGIVVEPVPRLFARLRENYRDVEGVVCENVAVGEEEGERPFWHVRHPDRPVPSWFDQIGSFDRGHLLRHKEFIPDIEELIVETRVRCTTLNRLVAKHGVDKLDLLHVDAEGYDDRIVQQIDFERFRPGLILYEHEHLDEESRRACHELLVDKGYRVLERGIDTIACRADLHLAP